MNFNSFASGHENIEDALKRYGLQIFPMYGNFVNQARNNLRFLIIMNFMTEQEAQVCMNRIIAKMWHWISLLEEE